jgi:hypothetical protein
MQNGGLWPFLAAQAMKPIRGCSTAKTDCGFNPKAMGWTPPHPLIGI